MVDWSKYPDLNSALRVGEYEENGNAIVDLDTLVSDVRRAERERCRTKCRLVANTVRNGAYREACLDCSAAIEALGDEDA